VNGDIRTARRDPGHRFDADAALEAVPEPVLLDEWQEVPELMGAVRRAVDEDPRPGRFLLAGSARAGRGTGMWSGIGRLVNLTMYGLTVRETVNRAEGSGFLDRLRRADLAEFPAPDDPPTCAVTSTSLCEEASPNRSCDSATQQGRRGSRPI
jgi:predicted AAA+ superfamily ATPase